MIRRILLLLPCLLLVTAPLFAEDDMSDRIRQLEQQIQELKTLKARQEVGKLKTEQCLKAVAQEKLCTCIGENLPASVTFEQYVHILVSTKNELGYGTLSAEERKTIDTTIATREKCVDRGFFN